MDLLTLSRSLKPIVLGWLEDAALGVVPGPHALDPAAGPHTGTLPLAGVGQSGAGAGEAPVWDGAAWTPTTLVHELAGVGGLGSRHTVSGLTAGQVLRATGATTAAFGALLASDLPSHASAHETGGDLVRHDNLTGFVANEHINHIMVSIAVSGLGLSGGGTIAASQTIALASSSNPGAAAAILASNAAGGLQLLSLGLGTAPTLNNFFDIVDGGGMGIPGGVVMAFDNGTPMLNVVNANLLINRPNDAVTPDGTIHAFTASAGTVTAWADADDGVFENNGDGGISILTPATATGRLVFGSPASNMQGRIDYNHNTDVMSLVVAGVGYFKLWNNTLQMQPGKVIDMDNSYITFTEMTAPAAGAANTARVFARDNGSGKSQLCVRFSTGAIQVLATEP